MNNRLIVKGWRNLCRSNNQQSPANRLCVNAVLSLGPKTSQEFACRNCIALHQRTAPTFWDVPRTDLWDWGSGCGTVGKRQNGPIWSKRPFWSKKKPFFRAGFQHSRDPKWAKMVHFGPFQATPTVRWPFLRVCSDTSGWPTNRSGTRRSISR